MKALASVGKVPLKITHSLTIRGFDKYRNTDE